MGGSSKSLSDLLDSTSEIVYVVDIDTYELLYANRAAIVRGGGTGLCGIPCYQALRGFDDVCPWCAIPMMVDGRAHLDEVPVPGTQTWFSVDCRDIEWDGHHAAAFFIGDISGLKQSRQMYEAAVDDAKLVVWEYDIVNHRVIMSDNEFTHYDYSKFELPKVIDNAPQSLVPYIDDDYVEAFLGMYAAIDGGAPKASCEVWYKLESDRQPRCERITYTTVFDGAGRPVSAYGTGQNITAQKADQERYERAFRQLAEAHPRSLGSFHLNLTKNWCGEGVSPLDFVLKQEEAGTVDGYFEEFAKLIADDDIKNWFFQTFDRVKLIDAFRKGQTQVSFEYPIVYADGVRHWREGLLYLVLNPATDDIEGVTYAIDIDYRKRSERVLQLIAADEFDYIAVIHPTTRMMEILDKKADVGHFEVGQQIGYDTYCEEVRDRVVAEQDVDRFLDMVGLDSVIGELREHGRLSVSFAYAEADSERRKRVSFRWLEQPEGDILVTRADVTSAYAQEQARIEQLKGAVDIAEQASAAEQVFLSNMSHDMRTPLNGIIGFTGLALDTDDAARKQDYLKKIDTSGKLMLALVNDVLDMSKIESGKMELIPQAFESKGLFASIIDSIQFSATERDIDLIANIDDGFPRFILADRLRLQQVVLNLLSNAIKYTPDGGRVSLEARPLDEPVEGCNVVLVVSDDGIGMSAAFQKRMFEPFSQEHQSRMYGTQGTGLGLSIVKRIVELMDGHIEAQSKLGEGSRFCIFLPLQPADAQSVGTEKVGDVRLADIAGKRIMLCEDNELNAEIACTILRERGHAEVECFPDGEQGLAAFRSSSPGYFDAILMDVRMPVMNGIETTEAIRALDRVDAVTIPIIAMTADAFEEDVKNCMQAGMNAHVAKPINPSELITLLEESLGGR